MIIKARLMPHGSIAKLWTEKGQVGGMISGVLFHRVPKGGGRFEFMSAELSADDVANLRTHTQVSLEAQGHRTPPDVVAAELTARSPTPEPEPATVAEAEVEAPKTVPVTKAKSGPRKAAV